MVESRSIPRSIMTNNQGKFEILGELRRFLGQGPEDVRAYHVSYQSGELGITAWLYEPPEVRQDIVAHPLDQPAPDGGAFIVGHGGVWGIPGHYDVVLRRLAKSGWTIAVPSYRGEDGSDGEIEFALGEIDDTIACHDALLSLPSVDPEKVWLLGSSHGAMVNLLTLARESMRDSFAGAVSVSGVYDIVQWMLWLKRVDHQLLLEDYFQTIIAKTVKELNARSVMTVASEISAPVFLVHGSADTMVPVNQSKTLARAFEIAGKSNFRLRVETNVDHEFIWGPDRPSAINTWDAIMDFIFQYG